VSDACSEPGSAGQQPPAAPAEASRWDRVVEWSGQQHFLIGASMFRLVAGGTILIQYLINYGQRRYLYGPDGVWPYAKFAMTMASSRNASLYAWSSSLWYFELVFHLGVLAAFLWMIGWRTRLLTPIAFVFWWSLHQRFPMLWDGGDNVMQLVFIYGLFANLGAHFSLDARRLAGRPPPAPWLAMLHNAAMIAFGVQISLVYAVAGLYKVQGETWRGGTALYYSFRGGQFIWPGVSELLYQSAWFTTAVSYLTVFFQISFPYLMIMNRYTRTAAVCVGVMFHIGIALFLGLFTFSFFMLSVDLAMIDDAEYRALFRFLKRAAGRAGALLAPRPHARRTHAGQPHTEEATRRDPTTLDPSNHEATSSLPTSIGVDS
jgi:hypothetical protein